MLYEKTNAEKSLFAQCTWLERWRRRKKAAVVDYSCNIHCDWVNSCVVHHCSATMCVWWMSDKHTILDVDMDASNGFHFSLILLPQFSTCSWVEGNKKTSRLVAQKKPDDNWTFSKSFSNHKCICVIVSTFCRYFYAYFWWIRIQKKTVQFLDLFRRCVYGIHTHAHLSWSLLTGWPLNSRWYYYASDAI